MENMKEFATNQNGLKKTMVFCLWKNPDRLERKTTKTGSQEITREEYKEEYACRIPVKISDRAIYISYFLGLWLFRGFSVGTVVFSSTDLYIVEPCSAHLPNVV